MLQNWQITQQTVAIPVVQPAAGGVISNASGSTLVDSTGVVSAALLGDLGNVTNFSSVNYNGSSSDILVAGSVLSFSASRQQNVLVLANISVAISPANVSGLVGIYVDDVQQITTNVSGSSTASLNYSSCTLWTVVNVGPGTHKADWRLVHDSTGNVWHMGAGGKVEAFSIGS